MTTLRFILLASRWQAMGDEVMALVDEWEARLTATRTTHLLDALVAELTTP